MNSKHHIFSDGSVHTLTKADTPEAAELILKESHEDLESRLNEIQWRLSESTVYAQYQEEFSLLLETLSVKVYSCSNPKSVLLCLRLLEEESKRILIQDKVNELMPIISIGFYQKD